MGNARYWVSVGYLENMRSDWQTMIGDLLQLPYAYCIHDKDTLLTDEQEKVSDHEERKKHVHIIIAFPNTTTKKHALQVFRNLNADGRQAFNTCEQVVNIRSKYNYLIHDTETSRKLKKHLYDKSERIEGNNFDIGAFEQVSQAEKEEMRRELSLVLLDMCFTTYSSFYLYVVKNFDNVYESIVVGYQGHFDKLCKGCFHKYEQLKKYAEKSKNEETEQ